MVTKTVDSRGRVTLGPTYANHLVLVQELGDGSIRIIPAEAVPAREVWVFKNPQAMESLRRGLEQAQAGQFAEGPDLAADAGLAESTPED